MFSLFSERPSRRVSVACLSYTRLQPEPVSSNVAATLVPALSGSISDSGSISISRGAHGPRGCGCGTINANPAGSPRFDSRLNTRVTRFHATTTSRFLEPFLRRRACGHGDLRACVLLRGCAEDACVGGGALTWVGWLDGFVDGFGVRMSVWVRVWVWVMGRRWWWWLGGFFFV
jgi:hypothetical protein